MHVKYVSFSFLPFSLLFPLFLSSFRLEQHFILACFPVGLGRKQTIEEMAMDKSLRCFVELGVLLIDRQVQDTFFFRPCILLAAVLVFFAYSHFSESSTVFLPGSPHLPRHSSMLRDSRHILVVVRHVEH